MLLLHDKVLKSEIISLEIEGSNRRASDVGRIHYKKYLKDYKVLEEPMYQSVSYSRAHGDEVVSARK